MKKTHVRILIILLLLFLILLFAPLTSGQTEPESKSKPEKEPRFSAEFFGGTYNLPGLFLEMGGLKKHPEKLSGRILGANFNVKVGGSWRLGATFFNIGSSGKGRWLREEDEQRLLSDHVVGEARGKTEISTKGIIFTVDREFRPRSVIRPFVSVGAGVGKVNAKFNGRFVGYETESGLNLLVDNPASENFNTVIPVVLMENGLRFVFKKQNVFSVSGYWNTGWGVKFATSIRF